MENSTAEAMRKLQEKASDLEAKLGEKEAAIAAHLTVIATHLNEKEAMATALQETEQQRQKLAIENDVLRLEMETKDRIHQEKIDAMIVQHMLDMRARFGRKTERFVDAESQEESLLPNLESEDPLLKDTAPEDI